MDEVRGREPFPPRSAAPEGPDRAAAKREIGGASSGAGGRDQIRVVFGKACWEEGGGRESARVAGRFPVPIGRKESIDFLQLQL